MKKKSPTPTAANCRVLLCVLLWAGCSAPHAGRSSRETVALGATAESIYGEAICPTRIAGSGGPGWRAAVLENGVLKLWKWSASAPLEKVRLTWDKNIRLTHGFQGVVNSRFILGGQSTLQNGVEVGEFDMATGQLLDSFRFDSTATHVAATRFEGGLAGAFIQAGGGKIIVDAFRRAYFPPMPGGGKSPWWASRFEFPSYEGPAGIWAAAVQGPDGRLWIFFTRDGAGQVGLLRFMADGGGLSAPEYDPVFIDRNQGDLSPSGELPPIYAVTDRRNQRILLGYQSYPYQLITCFYRRLASRVSIVEVRPDRAPTLLGVTDWWTPHIDFALPALFPRPNGIYGLLHFQNINTVDGSITGDCALGWNLAWFGGGRFEILNTLSEGRLCAVSEDGAFIFYTRGSNSSEIMKQRFAPQLRIQPGNPLLLTWDEAEPTDVLEHSTEGLTWQSMPYSGSPPIKVIASRPAEFFRIRRQ